MAFRNNDHIRNKRQADKMFVVIYEEAKNWLKGYQQGIVDEHTRFIIFKNEENDIVDERYKKIIDSFGSKAEVFPMDDLWKTDDYCVRMMDVVARNANEDTFIIFAGTGSKINGCYKYFVSNYTGRRFSILSSGSINVPVSSFAKLPKKDFNKRDAMPDEIGVTPDARIENGREEIGCGLMRNDNEAELNSTMTNSERKPKSKENSKSKHSGDKNNLVPVKPENKKDLFVENNSDSLKDANNSSHKETDGADLSVGTLDPDDISEKENGQLDESRDIEKAMEDPANFMHNVDSHDEEYNEPDVPDDFLDEEAAQVATSNVTNDDDAKRALKETNNDKNDSGQPHDKKDNQGVSNDRNNSSRTRQKANMKPDTGNLIDTDMVANSLFTEDKTSESKPLDDGKIEPGKSDPENNGVEHNEYPQRPDRVINQPAGRPSPRPDGATHKEELHNNENRQAYKQGKNNGRKHRPERSDKNSNQQSSSNETSSNKGYNKEAEITELDEKKVDLSNAVFLRLAARIRNAIPVIAKKAEAGEFAEEKYYEFVEMIMRSYDYEDFMNCWNMFNNDTKLNISEGLYSDIRSQSEYYCNLCAMLYITDTDN